MFRSDVMTAMNIGFLRVVSPSSTTFRRGDSCASFSKYARIWV